MAEHAVIGEQSEAAGDHAGAHGFSLSEALEHHNGAYPAMEWFHHQPIIIFDGPAYAALKYKNAHGVSMEAAQRYIEAHPAEIGHWTDQALITFPAPLSFFSSQTFFGTIALLLMFAFLTLFGRRRADQTVPRGRIQNMIEAVVQFVRDDMVRPNIPHGDHWTAHIVCIFLAILSFNLIGLIPGTGTASGNPGVTAAFAITTLATMLFFGMREQGVVAYWKNLVPVHFSLKPIDLFVWVLLAIIEVLSLIIKPTALAIRLFANMFAGHTVLLAFTSLGFILHSANAGSTLELGLGLGGFGLAVAIYALELLVAFVQAYVFTLLSAVFIGQSIHPEH